MAELGQKICEGAGCDAVFPVTREEAKTRTLCTDCNPLLNDNGKKRRCRVCMDWFEGGGEYCGGCEKRIKASGMKRKVPRAGPSMPPERKKEGENMHKKTAIPACDKCMKDPCVLEEKGVNECPDIKNPEHLKTAKARAYQKVHYKKTHGGKAVSKREKKPLRRAAAPLLAKGRTVGRSTARGNGQGGRVPETVRVELPNFAEIKEISGSIGFKDGTTFDGDLAFGRNEDGRATLVIDGTLFAPVKKTLKGARDEYSDR